jgi:hypothetical protein
LWDILDIFGFNDKVRKVRRIREKAVIMDIDIEILDSLGVNAKVR